MYIVFIETWTVCLICRKICGNLLINFWCITLGWGFLVIVGVIVDSGVICTDRSYVNLLVIVTKPLSRILLIKP